MNRVAYVVILVDNGEDADELNFEFNRFRSDKIKIQAFSSIQQMVGLQFKGNRPTHIIDAIKDRSHLKFEGWYNSEVLRNAVKARLIGGKPLETTNKLIPKQVGEVTLTSINNIYISEVERLFKMLQDNKFAAPETKSEIELTIQAYMKQIREFHMEVE